MRDSENWNLEIQRELARNTTFEIRYVGTKGSRLWGALDLNQIDSLHHNTDLFNQLLAVRAGGESVPTIRRSILMVGIGEIRATEEILCIIWIALAPVFCNLRVWAQRSRAIHLAACQVRRDEPVGFHPVFHPIFDSGSSVEVVGARAAVAVSDTRQHKERD